MKPISGKKIGNGFHNETCFATWWQALPWLWCDCCFGGAVTGLAVAHRPESRCRSSSGVPSCRPPPGSPKGRACQAQHMSDSAREDGSPAAALRKRPEPPPSKARQIVSARHSQRHAETIFIK